VKNINLAQLAYDSGFSLGALISHETLPIDLKLQLGYFGINLDAMQKPFLKFDLPQGVAVNSFKSDVDLKSRFLISHEPTLAQRLQSILDVLIHSSKGSAIVGVSNVIFGGSENDAFKTFSKIVVEVDAAKFKGKLPEQASVGHRTQSLATLTGAEFSVLNGKNIHLGAQASLHGLDSITVHLGGISLVFF
jgi:hypothetical protein